jgi:hypothetical protein
MHEKLEWWSNAKDWNDGRLEKWNIENRKTLSAL